MTKNSAFNADKTLVEEAREAGCKRLLSEDLQHGQHSDGLTIENPFSPDSITPDEGNKRR